MAPRPHRASLHGLLVLRFLMLANGAILGCVGGLYLAFGSRPGGYVAGGLLVGAAVVVWSLIPLTDPYRAERARHGRSW